MNFLRAIVRWLAQSLGIVEPAAPGAGNIDAARARFMRAYNDQDYAGLCDVFHEHAKFRGSVFPERWTYSRDSIMTDRYMSSETCTAIRSGAVARPRAGTRSVGSMSLSLVSERIAPIGPNYASDLGRFRMDVNPGFDVAATAGPYFILWRRDEGADWKMIHIDMNP